MLKRLTDIIISSSALVLLSPLFVILIAIIWITDRGQPFYRQIRVGKSCQTFQMIKFRSMVINADQIGGHSTQQNDPRITPIGKWLRKTSLDELPQLINVLKGDMSVIGPRPDVPAQKSNYSNHDWLLRHTIRPGITGLSQALLRSTASPEQRLQLDLEYVRDRNFILDMKVLWLTLRRLVTMKGGN